MSVQTFPTRYHLAVDIFQSGSGGVTDRQTWSQTTSMAKNIDMYIDCADYMCPFSNTVQVSHESKKQHYRKPLLK